jgi:DNA-binding transcriptional MerR regulator
MGHVEARFLTITEVSRVTGYCVSHLRELVNRGIVRPERTNTGVRLFTNDDVGRLKARRARIRNVSGHRQSGREK